MDDMRSRPLPEADLLYVLRAAQGVWEGLRGQRIFITGATGFVGRWLMESLQAADYALGLDVQVVAPSRGLVQAHLGARFCGHADARDLGGSEV